MASWNATNPQWRQPQSAPLLGRPSRSWPQDYLCRPFVMVVHFQRENRPREWYFHCHDRGILCTFVSCVSVKHPRLTQISNLSRLPSCALYMCIARCQWVPIAIDHKTSRLISIAWRGKKRRANRLAELVDRKASLKLLFDGLSLALSSPSGRAEMWTSRHGQVSKLAWTSQNKHGCQCALDDGFGSAPMLQSAPFLGPPAHR